MTGLASGKMPEAKIKSGEGIEGMSRKRIGLVLASEETYSGASLGIVHQILAVYLLYGMRRRRKDEKTSLWNGRKRACLRCVCQYKDPKN
jgi:hypothetical protein